MEHRVELSTQFTSIHNLREGVHLYLNGHDPYSSSIFHHPPLLIPLYNHFDPAILSVVSHVISTNALYSISPASALLYALNPLNVLSLLSNSTQHFVHLPLILAFTSASKGRATAAGAALALATYCDIYALTLAVPLAALVISNQKEDAPKFKTLILAFVANFSALISLSYILIGSFSFVKGVWGCQLTTCSLMPTIGLNWYFFIEQFDHFRSLFLCLFTLHHVSYSVPITVLFRHQPIFAFLLLWCLHAIFNPYPTLTTFTTPFLLLYTTQSHLIAHLPSLWHAALAIATSYCLLPAFYDAWIDGRGNANFFYAATLVHALGGILCVTGWARGAKKWEWELYNKATDGDKKDWVIRE